MAADGDPPGTRLVSIPAPRRDSVEGALPTGRVVVSDCGHLPGRPDLVRNRPEPFGKLIVVLCVRGRGWCEFDGRRLDVGPGQVMVLPPGRPHAYGSDPDDPWIVWWVHLVGDGLDELVASWPVVADVPDVFRVSGLISEIVDELEDDVTDASLIVASGAGCHLLSYLAARPHLPGDTTSPLDRAREYLRAHAAERIPVSVLAERANLSPSHFAAAFRERFGIPVHRYQTELRMAEARRLLDTTGLRIAAIAARVGYPDPYYFSRQFTAIHRTTPRAYRRLSKG